MKFTLVPREIEAFQLTRETRADNSDWPEWMHMAWQKEPGEIGAIWPHNGVRSDGTDELLLKQGDGSVMVVSFGSWIFTSRGFLGVMSNSLFTHTYQAVMPADEEEDLEQETLARMRGFLDAIEFLEIVGIGAKEWAGYLTEFSEIGALFDGDAQRVEQAIVAGADCMHEILMRVGHEHFGEPWAAYNDELEGERMNSATLAEIREMRDRGELRQQSAAGAETAGDG